MRLYRNTDDNPSLLAPARMMIFGTRTIGKGKRAQQTGCALERLGVLERTHEFPEEWRDSRRLTTQATK